MITNEERANKARLALDKMSSWYENDLPENITNLMTDLMHLADQHGMDVTDLMEHCHNYYDREVREETP